MAQGRPVLPALTYDITLLPTSPGTAIAIPRGVRLLSAKSLPDLENFNPHVTTPVTDQIYPQQQEDPTLRAREIWLPDLPYAIQRTSQRSAAGSDILTDQLVISPAQFYASNGETGQLRRFTEMVFEVTYVEPQIAPAAVLAQSSSPLFGDVRITPLGPAGANAIQAAGQLVRFSAIVSDSNGSQLREVSATYTADGLNWQRKQLLLNPATGRYEATLSAPAAGANISAFFESLDNAGNVAVETRKGALASLEYIFMPVFSKQSPADLTGSLRLSPGKLTFAAGEPVTIDVTITNNGSARAAAILGRSVHQPIPAAHRRQPHLEHGLRNDAVLWHHLGRAGRTRPRRQHHAQLRAGAVRGTLQHLARLLRARHGRPVPVRG